MLECEKMLSNNTQFILLNMRKHTTSFQDHVEDEHRIHQYEKMSEEIIRTTSHEDHVVVKKCCPTTT